MIQADVYRAISQSSEVLSIADDRIYAVRLPREADVPAVVYRIPSIDPVSSMDGDSGIDNGSVEVVCWAKDYRTAHELAHAVRNSFAEAGLRTITESINDDEDSETRNFGVIINLKIWSDSNVGVPAHNARNPISALGQAEFIGNGVTINFTLPKFRSGSLLIFKNGRLVKKGVESDLESVYWEKTTLDGFTFRAAPAGGEYKDELLAFYAAD